MSVGSDLVFKEGTGVSDFDFGGGEGECDVVETSSFIGETKGEVASRPIDNSEAAERISESSKGSVLSISDSAMTSNEEASGVAKEWGTLIKT